MISRRAQSAFLVAVHVVVLAGLIAAGAGCASSGPARAGAATGDAKAGATRGVELEFYQSGDDGTFARYFVERDGRLSFGGGLDAMNGTYTWSGPLTAEEIEQLLGLIEAGGWREVDPASTGNPPGRSYTIRLRTPGTRRTFTVLGDEGGVVAVRGVLETASRRRYEGFLEALPRPGLQR